MKSLKIKKVAHALFEHFYVKDIKNHPVMIEAEKSDDEVLKIIAKTLVGCQEIIKNSVNLINKYAEKYENTLDEQDINEIASLATAFDDSGDENLMKQASVLDQLLINFGQTSNLNAVKAQDAEIEKIKKLREKETDKNYTGVKNILDDFNKVKETREKVHQQVKAYRPLEHPLETRYCPDHVGTPIMRIGEATFQCAIDNKIYNYREGFTTESGDTVPGTSAGVQSQSIQYDNDTYTIPSDVIFSDVIQS